MAWICDARARYSMAGNGLDCVPLATRQGVGGFVACCLYTP